MSTIPFILLTSGISLSAFFADKPKRVVRMRCIVSPERIVYRTYSHLLPTLGLLFRRVNRPGSPPLRRRRGLRLFYLSRNVFTPFQVTDLELELRFGPIDRSGTHEGKEQKKHNRQSAEIREAGMLFFSGRHEFSDLTRK